MELGSPVSDVSLQEKNLGIQFGDGKKLERQKADTRKTKQFHKRPRIKNSKIRK
jgi:hypothetical protein